MQQMYIDMHFHDLDISLAYSKHNPREKTFSSLGIYKKEKKDILFTFHWEIIKFSSSDCFHTRISKLISYKQQDNPERLNS